MKMYSSPLAAAATCALAPILSLTMAPSAMAQSSVEITDNIPLGEQQGASERVNLVLVYGDDACPPSTADEIVVCARQPEGERYRIPEDLRVSDDPANTSWGKRTTQLETAGDFGTMSCSPVGAGGFTGCTQQLVNSAYAEKANSPDVRYSLLIEEERRRRLENIDEDAAAEQERVEQIEREYMRRLEAERDGTSGTEVEVPEDTTSAPAAPSAPGA